MTKLTLILTLNNLHNAKPDLNRQLKQSINEKENYKQRWDLNLQNLD